MQRALEKNRDCDINQSVIRGNCYDDVPQILNYSFWIHILCRTFTFFYLDRKNFRYLFVPSFSLMQAMAIQFFDATSTLAKPNFGAGSWEQLAQMRLKKGQPASLFFPNIESCSFRPDGYWLGSMSHYHDFYHTERVNKIIFPTQQTLILLDEICVRPMLSFVKRLTPISDESKPMNNRDLKFIDGYKTLISMWEPQQVVVQSSVARLELFLKSMSEGNNKNAQVIDSMSVRNKRGLIDQEQRSGILVETFKDDLFQIKDIDVAELIFRQYMLWQFTVHDDLDDILELLDLTVVREQPYPEQLSFDVLNNEGTVDKTASQQTMFQWCFSYWESVFKN